MVTALTNGNYVVSSDCWANASATCAGAVTLGNGTTGTTGEVSATNSLIGVNTGDHVGHSVAALTNGNYVVGSPDWNSGAGAATWGDGTSGVTGIVSGVNSLVGTNAGDEVGNSVRPLVNGNYVVTSPNWANGPATSAGAATWADGTTGITGQISASNSLVGTTTGDQVGGYAAFDLLNGNYVVGSPYWDNGSTANVGAAT